MSELPSNHRAAPAPIYDAAIVGAGIVGLAVALALTRQGRQVAVVEPAPPRRMRGALGWDLRSVALAPPAVAFLRELDDGGGANVPPAPRQACIDAPRLARINAPRLARIDAMHVWERDGGAWLDFAGQPARPLAWVVENSAWTTWAWELAQQRATVVAAAVTGLATAADAAELALAAADGGSRGVLRARLVVVADGAASKVRGLAGAGVRREPLPANGTQCAIATVARLCAPHRNMAWQRFGSAGPAALLPLPEACHAAVIWCAPEGRQAQRLALADEAFRRALEDELEGAGGGIEAVDRRLGFAVRQTLATDLNPSPRVVLAGDAVRTLHPLAGQGVNLGLEDARAIAATAAAAGADLGADGLWRGYARQRRVRSKAMLGLMRALLAAYGCTRPGEGAWRRLARNTALRCINASPAAKAQLVREAMALGPLGDGGAAHAA